MSPRQSWYSFLGALAVAGAFFLATWFYRHGGSQVIVNVWSLDFWLPVILLAIVPMGMAAYGGHVAADAYSEKWHRLRVRLTFWAIGLIGLGVAFSYQYRTMKTDSTRQTATQNWEESVNQKLDNLMKQSSPENKEQVLRLKKLVKTGPSNTDVFNVSIEYARLSVEGKEYGTNFWAYYPSEKGCSISSIQGAYFIRIKSLRSIPISIIGYGISVSGIPLKRVFYQIGSIVGIPYKDGRMFGTTNDLVDALRLGSPINFAQGPGFSWGQIPIEGSDFKKSVLLQFDLIDDLLKSPLQPNVPVRGWSFFQASDDSSIAGPTRITLETDDSQTFSYDFNLSNPKWSLDNQDRIITVKAFADLSNCARD